MIQTRVIVHGSVQGVFFRSYTQEMATQKGVTGWVQNNPDGTVEAVFQGNESAVAAMVQWCHEGSPQSQVTRVDALEEAITSKYSAFSIDHYTEPD